MAAVGARYAEPGTDGGAPRPRRVLDLMSSWVSHLRTPPAELVVLGMNAQAPAANPAATERIVHDLDAEPRVPLPDGDVDAVVCREKDPLPPTARTLAAAPAGVTR